MARSPAHSRRRASCWPAAATAAAALQRLPPLRARGPGFGCPPLIASCINMLQGEEEEEGRYEGYSAGGALLMAAAAAAVPLPFISCWLPPAPAVRPCSTRHPAFPRPADHLAASNPGLRPHPDPLVESASLASVPKPKLTFQHSIAEAVSGGKARATASWALG